MSSGAESQGLGLMTLVSGVPSVAVTVMDCWVYSSNPAEDEDAWGLSGQAFLSTGQPAFQP